MNYKSLGFWILIITIFAFSMAIFLSVKYATTLTKKLLAVLGVFSFLWIVGILLKIFSTDILELITIFELIVFALTIVFVKTDDELKDYRSIKLENGWLIEDVFMGVGIVASAGSAKTRGVIVKLFKAFAKRKLAGIIFCYKNLELVEYMLPLYPRNDIYTFAPSYPNITCKLNPLDAKLIEDESTIEDFYRSVYKTMKKKHKASSGASEFFENATVGLAVGITWIMKSHDAKHCSIPHIASVCLGNDRATLSKILETDMRASVKASAFLNASSEATNDVMATIAVFFNYFANPRAFYCLYDEDGKYVDMKVNNPKRRKNLCFVNDMANEETFMPLINALIFYAIKKCLTGPRCPMQFMVDEGSAINANHLSDVPAKLRAYDITTIFCIQSISLAYEKLGREETEATFSNLSTKFIGKTEDPNTGKFFENIFRYKDVRKTTRSYKSGIFGSMNGNVSEQLREQKEFRAPDFAGLQKGEFIAFFAGFAKKIFFKYSDKFVEKREVEDVRKVAQEELDRNYVQILAWGRQFPTVYFNSFAGYLNQ